MQLAAGRGYTDLVEELLEKDAGIDHQDNVSVCHAFLTVTACNCNDLHNIMFQDGQTALIKASIFNHSAIVSRLINYTADLDIQDKVKYGCYHGKIFRS